MTNYLSGRGRSDDGRAEDPGSDQDQGVAASDRQWTNRRWTSPTSLEPCTRVANATTAKAGAKPDSWPMAPTENQRIRPPD
jgi:hypothetical protein